MLDELVRMAQLKGSRFRIVAVQPGVTRQSLVENAKLGSLLGMAAEYVTNAYCDDLIVWSS